jgi:predicted RNase H-like nuclease
MRYVGADGCRAGWFWVGLDEHRGWACGIATDAEELWATHRHAERLLVDIPVGLREAGEEERDCDLLARELLGGGRASSVYPAPCRAATREDDPAEASRVNEERTGRGLSVQSRALLPRIRRVDALLAGTPEARGVVREMHPEVAFWGLNGGTTIPTAKREAEGQVERLAVLDAHDPRAPRVVSASLLRFPRNQVGRDDVLDALAGAVTATRTHGLRTLPPEPETDPTGLPMEMVLWAPRDLEVPAGEA